MPAKVTGPEQVAKFFTDLDHPLKDALQRIREIILSSDKTITEHVKWKAPSFCHNGDDRVTCNMYRDGSILLIFHRGAKVKDSKGKGHLIDDPTGLLEWPADDRATLKLTSLDDVNEKQSVLKKLVKLWIAAA